MNDRASTPEPRRWTIVVWLVGLFVQFYGANAFYALANRNAADGSLFADSLLSDSGLIAVGSIVCAIGIAISWFAVSRMKPYGPFGCLIRSTIPGVLLFAVYVALRGGRKRPSS